MRCAAATDRIGIVLAGGSASVAGWRWRAGVSLLEQSRRILQRAAVDRIIVSGGPDGDDRILDDTSGMGPLGGLVSVLRCCPDLAGRTLLVMPSDMPALNPRALVRLAEIAELQGSGATFDLGPLPLAVVASATLLDAADEVMANTGSLGEWVAKLGLPVLASLPDDGLDNIGNSSQLEALRQRIDSMRSALS